MQSQSAPAGKPDNKSFCATQLPWQADMPEDTERKAMVINSPFNGID